MKSLSSIALVAAASLPALAVSGRVVGPDGQPIEGARVCHMQVGVEQLCTATRADGTFDALDVESMPLRIVADGYLAEERPGIGRHDPIALRRAPVLVVRLVDAGSGAALDKAEVVVRRSRSGSGEEPEKGPFPANRAGVKIQRVLEPGEVRVIGRAEGYEESAPRTVLLEGGKETAVVLELTRKPAKPPR